jgi:glycosyltransferase involved in cell wall biosynthesis
MRLSILIPSVPSRFKILSSLFFSVEYQIARRKRTDLLVEVLAFTDNKQRSVGCKRNDLLSLAHGKYIAFLDDDDSISMDYIDKLLEATDSDADVIVFRQAVWLNGERAGDVVFGLEYENQEVLGLGTVATRKPFPCCAWKLSTAIRGLFSDVNDGEDWHWVQQVAPLAKTQHRIDETLHVYRWSKETTEATIKTWEKS